MIVATVSVIGVLALTIERFVYFDRSFTNISNGDHLAPCSSVVCTSDFTFAVVLLINLGK